MIEKCRGKVVMWTVSVRLCNFLNFFLITMLNAFESSTWRTCSRTEPKYDIQSRVDRWGLSTRKFSPG